MSHLCSGTHVLNTYCVSSTWTNTANLLLDTCSLLLPNFSFFASTPLCYMSSLPWWQGVFIGGGRVEPDWELNSLKDETLCYGRNFAADQSNGLCNCQVNQAMKQKAQALISTAPIRKYTMGCHCLSCFSFYPQNLLSCLSAHDSYF